MFDYDLLHHGSRTSQTVHVDGQFGDELAPLQPRAMVPAHRGLLPASSLILLEQARTTWAQAALEVSVADRYRNAHLSALRAAAAILAAKARPNSAIRRRPTSAWVLLDAAAPELSEWSAHFADSARRRASVEAGVTHAVSERDADDLVRAAGEFIALVTQVLLRTPMAA
jgi:hypothetical protein